MECAINYVIMYSTPRAIVLFLTIKLKAFKRITRLVLKDVDKLFIVVTQFPEKITIFFLCLLLSRFFLAVNNNWLQLALWPFLSDLNQIHSCMELANITAKSILERLGIQTSSSSLLKFKTYNFIWRLRR